MRSVVLDSGAFIAAERRDRTLAEFVKAALREDALIVLPAAVLCEVWKATPRHGSVGLRRNVSQTVSLDAKLATEVGQLLDAAKSEQIVDAVVALVAVRNKPSLVLTSDSTDISMFVKATGSSCAIAPKVADVVIARV